MEARSPGIAVIGPEGDALCRSVAATLEAVDIPVRRWKPTELSNLGVSLGDELMLVDGRAVAGVFFHSHPERCFSADYVARDRAFCDAETRAVWLSALNLESVLALNRYDAGAWFEGLGWATWRRRLRRAGVPVAEIHAGGREAAGARWHLFGSGEQHALPRTEVQRCLAAATTCSEYAHHCLAVGGSVLDEPASPAARAAAAALASQGIWLARLWLDQHDAVLAVDPLPRVDSARAIHRISRKALGAFDEHLDRWRHRRFDRGLYGVAGAQARLAGAQAARRPAR